MAGRIDPLVTLPAGPLNSESSLEFFQINFPENRKTKIYNTPHI